MNIGIKTLPHQSTVFVEKLLEEGHPVGNLLLRGLPRRAVAERVGVDVKGVVCTATLTARNISFNPRKRRP
jgi:hypothetical protein